jgi:hypothetical protein
VHETAILQRGLTEGGGQMLFPVPIDWNWQHLTPLETFVQKVRDAGQDPKLQEDEAFSVDEILADWEHAKALAHDKGWEGDFRVGPYIFWLPTETGFTYAFAFKQDNNGTTFIVSPVQLQWVEEFAC